MIRSSSHSTIRRRVLVITLLPLMLITLLLGGYFIHTQVKDAEEALLERGATMSHLLASAAEFGLLSGSPEMLSSLIRSQAKQDDVSDIIFLDSAFNTVLRSNPEGPAISRESAYPYESIHEIYFLQPVVSTGIDILDSPEFQNEARDAEIIGWVAVALSREPTQLRQKEIILKGVTIALIGFLLTLYIAAQFGRRITTPILGLTQVVKELEKGHLDVRSTIHATGELQTLSRGINRLAQRVQESNQTLESRVSRSTTRLRSTLVHLERQNLALGAARKKADKANKAKDDFLARMSHELRTPLTSVLGFAKLLDQTAIQPEQKEYTRIINLTSSLLLSIIDDILDFSKLQSNAIKLEHLPLDIEALVYDTIEMQSPSAHVKGLELIPIIAPDVPRSLIGDPMRIRQILTNLISNAIKFTHEGHVAVHVQRMATADNRHTLLHIRIEDTGIGISQHRVQNLFHAFAQADDSITRKFGGSGLGLVIAKLLAELMDGNIDLSSQESKGTSVSLRIPLENQESPDEHSSLPQQPLQIALFDRHPLNRRSLKYQLSSLSIKPTAASSFEKLLDSIHKTQPNCALWSLSPGATAAPQFPDELARLRAAFGGNIILLSCEPISSSLPCDVQVLRKPVRTYQLNHSLTSRSTETLPLTESTEQSPPLAIKVLIAEDNDFNRMLLNRILSQAGAQVVEAVNGEEAIEIARHNRFDLIVMDVHMPKVDGIQATHEIKSSIPDIPIIALTANVIESEHKKLLAAGIDRILLKPINDVELKNALREFTSTSPDMEQPEKQGSIQDYQISRETLHDELLSQLGGLSEGFINSNIDKMRYHSHQLLGLAGLYELPELEVNGTTLHQAIKDGSPRDTWYALWRLQRTINNSQY